jgi:hypothetical protein
MCFLIPGEFFSTVISTSYKGPHRFEWSFESTPVGGPRSIDGMAVRLTAVGPLPPSISLRFQLLILSPLRSTDKNSDLFD